MLYLLEADHAKNWVKRADYVEGEAHTWFIIRASSEKEAREIAAMKHGTEGPDCWNDTSTVVRLIAPNGPTEVLGMWS